MTFGRIGVAFLALTLGTGSAGFAQASSTSPAVLADHTLRASKLLNAPVFNAKGEEVGTIDDILVDPRSGAARAVLAIGRYVDIAGAMVAVPLSTVQFGTGQLSMPKATRETLAAMPKWTYHSQLEGGGS